MKVERERFGEVGGKPVDLFTWGGEDGLKVSAINYGCIITSMTFPDRRGVPEHIVLGHDTLDEYLRDPYYLGAVVGRVAGRIAGGTFELEGKTHELARNDGPHHLHGGIRGLDKTVWEARVIEDGVEFSCLSPDGDEHYPGNVRITVTYRIRDGRELVVRYRATTDAATLLALTNHTYFNLSGNAKRDILDHRLTLKSRRFLELDGQLIPTGRLLDAEGTPFDFTRGGFIRAGTVSDHPQNRLAGGGYDHPFVLDEHHREEIVLEDPESGRRLAIETDEPAVVVYTGNFLKPEGHFRGAPSRKHLGICLETQAYPDAVHHPHFPSVVLRPGEEYASVTRYRFSCE
jgi:aldose 1-epimerase